jgi:TPR repeat protein
MAVTAASIFGSHQEQAAQDAASYAALEKAKTAGADAFNRNFYEQRCGWGDASACGKTAVMYWEGRGTAQDRVKALALHHKACDGGYTESCEALKTLPDGQVKTAADELFRQAGTMSVFGANGKKSVKDSQGDATAMFVRACDAGSMQGCAEAAARYRDGNGVASDYGRALELYRKACVGGERNACQDVKGIPASQPVNPAPTAQPADDDPIGPGGFITPPDR